MQKWFDSSLFKTKYNTECLTSELTIIQHKEGKNANDHTLPHGDHLAIMVIM